MGSNAHIPYRDSKLTRILQPSLGGNARTAIICTLSPATSHIEQSRNTLFFGSCAKDVATNAQVNVVMSDKTLVKQLQKEVARLESELRHPVSSSSLEAQVKEKDNQIRKVGTTSDLLFASPSFLHSSCIIHEHSHFVCLPELSSQFIHYT
jgi:centromeric protein E